MYMYPVSASVDLPEDWARSRRSPTDPFDVAPADITKNREEWLARGRTR